MLAFVSAAAACSASVRIEAYRGEPFGVGRVTVSLPSDDSLAPGSDDRFAVSDAAGRVLYPVIEQKRIRRLLRRFLGIELPNRVTFYFMFRGEEPLELTVYTPEPQRFAIVPQNDAEEFRDVLDDWWQATEDHYQRVHRDAEYPITVDNYLTANWARRFGRPMPDPGLSLFGSDKIGGGWVAQLTANEAYQAAIERDLVLGRFGSEQVAELPLPAPPQMPPLVLPARPDEPAEGELPAPGAHVEIEPIARHVPHECFYARFGNYTNYLWFRDFLRHWQGDLGNMVVLRSIDRGLNDRLQEQIAIRDTQIARIMGPTVIRDVAMIGYDFYLRDGAAFGMLFHANNNLLLSRNFNRQRDAAAAKYDAAKMETVSIAGHDVSFLSTPDGKLRSYYATDGDFHLITTSRALVERFYEIGADANNAGSLAESDEFVKARVEMPLARNDTIFFYLSAAFFENLAGPQYRVELDRRLRSVGEMRVLELARLAAGAEGSAAQTVDELVAGEFLPRGFGTRADGSQLVATDAGYRDSVRGVPGWYIPVADMPVERITRAESQHYAAFTRSIQREVGRFVPIVAAVGRATSDDGQIDRLVVDAHIAPYSQTGMARWARLLAPDDGLRLAPIAGDVAALEVMLDALGQPIHVFGGMRDFNSPLAVRQGAVASELTPSEFIRGYIGTWPRPLALLDTFLGRPTTALDRHGIARNDRLFDLWLRQADDFFLFSFKRDVLMEVGPQLAMVRAERPGQIRLRVDDLTDKQIATGISGLGYMRTRSASASASRFMNALTTQLHVPPAEARELAEQLVGGRFVDPLGGEYTLVDGETALPFGETASAVGPTGEHLPTPGGRQLWASTAITPQNRFLLTEIPADYRMPLMDWFRGLVLDAGRYDPLDAVMLHAELDMTPLDTTPPVEKEDETGGGFSLPSLGGLLGGWGAQSDQPTVAPIDQPQPSKQVAPAAHEEDIPPLIIEQPATAPADDSGAPPLFPVDPSPAP
jgi:hypothetical protein